MYLLLHAIVCACENRRSNFLWQAVSVFLCLVRYVLLSVPECFMHVIYGQQRTPLAVAVNNGKVIGNKRLASHELTITI